MIIKIAQNKLDKLNQIELNHLQHVLIQLEKLTPKSSGGIVEVFQEKQENNNLSYKDLYKKIGFYLIKTDVKTYFENNRGEEENPELVGIERFLTEQEELKQQDKESDMYISSVNRTYVTQ